jgi:hypothetical protein
MIIPLQASPIVSNSWTIWDVFKVRNLWHKSLMFRYLLRWILIFSGIFLLSMLLIRARPYDDSDLRAFLTPPDGCPAPCFMGIRPGVTMYGDVLAILENHAWVTNLRLERYGDAPRNYNYGRFIWDWSDATPDFIDRRKPGGVNLIWLSFYQREGDVETEVVAGTISIATTIPIHLAQQFFGTPNSGVVGLSSDHKIGYTVSYDLANSARPTVTGLRTTLPCPANLLSYWHGHAEMYETVWTGTDKYVSPQDAVKLC